MHCSTVAVKSVSRAGGVFVYYTYMYISAEVYCTRELTRCESTVASLPCLAKPKVTQIHTTSSFLARRLYRC